MERQRPARVHWQGLFGFCEFHRRGRHLPAGDELQPHQIELDLPQYHIYWNSSGQKGLLRARRCLPSQEPLSVTYDFGEDIHRHERARLTCEYPDFYLVCCYTPNSAGRAAPLSYRMEWEDALRQYLCELDTIKPVVYCGDLNVAHEEIDLKNPKTNHFNPGFSARGARQDDAAFVLGLSRFVPHAVPRQDGRLFVVELPRPVARTERGVENRLFHRLRTPALPHRKRGYLS